MILVRVCLSVLSNLRYQDLRRSNPFFCHIYMFNKGSRTILDPQNLSRRKNYALASGGPFGSNFAEILSKNSGAAAPYPAWGCRPTPGYTGQCSANRNKAFLAEALILHPFSMALFEIFIYLQYRISNRFKVLKSN